MNIKVIVARQLRKLRSFVMTKAEKAWHFKPKLETLAKILPCLPARLAE